MIVTLVVTALIALGTALALLAHDSAWAPPTPDSGDPFSALRGRRPVKWALSASRVRAGEGG
jgi:hypothetical protein